MAAQQILMIHQQESRHSAQLSEAMHTWLVPRVLARLLEREISARYSCDPDICSAEPTPVTQRQASSCVKFRDMPQPIIPACTALR